MGTDDLFRYMEERNISLKANVLYWLKDGKRKRPWGELVNQGNRDLVSTSNTEYHVTISNYAWSWAIRFQISRCLPSFFIERIVP